MNYDLTDWLNVFIMTSDKPQMKLQFMHEKEVGLPSNVSAVVASVPVYIAATDLVWTELASLIRFRSERDAFCVLIVLEVLMTNHLTVDAYTVIYAANSHTYYILVFHHPLTLSFQP